MHIVFDYENYAQDYRENGIHAWAMGSKIDSKTLGQKKAIPLEPYLRWVWSRAQNIIMPYPAVLPVIVDPVVEGDIPHTIFHPDIPTDLEELQKS